MSNRTMVRMMRNFRNSQATNWLNEHTHDLEADLPVEGSGGGVSGSRHVNAEGDRNGK